MEMLHFAEEIRARFPQLQMKIATDDPDAEITLDAPEQPGLEFRLHLRLQGDELHLMAGAFWLEWFPCGDPEVQAAFREAACGLISGRYRILEHCRRGCAVKAQLQRPVGGGWETIGTWSTLGLPVPWTTTKRVIQNSALRPRV